MNKKTYHPKLELNTEVVTKFRQLSDKRGLIHEKARRLMTCCDGLTYATNPYKY